MRFEGNGPKEAAGSNLELLDFSKGVGDSGRGLRGSLLSGLNRTMRLAIRMLAA